MNVVGLKGTISAGNPSPVIILMAANNSNSNPPYTISFKSAGAATFSFDGGATYQTVTASITGSGQLIYFLNNPFTHVKFTGSNGDTYQVL